MDFTELSKLKLELKRFLMNYKFALDELNTRIQILRQEFQYVHDYNPIEYTKSRVKTPDSILNKAQRKNIKISLSSIQENIKDIAGLRITCSFLSDIYQISDMLSRQPDLEIVELKDYIKKPKPNGYKSLHLIIKVPVFMSDRVEKVWVEVQVRSIAMDFWASLEHKLYYKYDQDVPQYLLDELKSAAVSVADLDQRMEKIHREITKYKKLNGTKNDMQELQIANERFHLPINLIRSLLEINE